MALGGLLLLRVCDPFTHQLLPECLCVSMHICDLMRPHLKGGGEGRRCYYPSQLLKKKKHDTRELDPCTLLEAVLWNSGKNFVL